MKKKFFLILFLYYSFFVSFINAGEKDLKQDSNVLELDTGKEYSEKELYKKNKKSGWGFPYFFSYFGLNLNRSNNWLWSSNFGVDFHYFFKKNNNYTSNIFIGTGIGIYQYLESRDLPNNNSNNNNNDKKKTSELIGKMWYFNLSARFGRTIFLDKKHVLMFRPFVSAGIMFPMKKNYTNNYLHLNEDIRLKNAFIFESGIDFVMWLVTLGIQYRCIKNIYHIRENKFGTEHYFAFRIGINFRNDWRHQKHDWN